MSDQLQMPTAPKPLAPDFATDPIVNFPNLVLILSAGQCGSYDGPTIKSIGNAPGHLAYGPYWPLKRGSYVADFDIVGTAIGRLRNDLIAVAEVVDGGTFFGRLSIMGQDLEARTFAVPFDIPGTSAWRPVEFRVWVSGKAPVMLAKLTVRRL